MPPYQSTVGVRWRFARRHVQLSLAGEHVAWLILPQCVILVSEANVLALTVAMTSDDINKPALMPVTETTERNPGISYLPRLALQSNH